MYITSNTGEIDIDLNFSLINGSFYTLVISTQADMTLNNIAISRMIFDKTAIEAIGNDYFDYGIVAGTNNADLVTTIPPDILPSNLFFGIHSFAIPASVGKIYYKSNYTINTGSIGLYPQTGYTHT